MSRRSLLRGAVGAGAVGLAAATGAGSVHEFASATVTIAQPGGFYAIT